MRQRNDPSLTRRKVRSSHKAPGALAGALHGNYLYNHAAILESQRSVLWDLKDRLRNQDQLTLAGAIHLIDQMLKETNELDE